MYGRIEFISLILLLSLGACKEDVRKEYYANGKIKSLFQLTKGMRNGLSEEYDSTGALRVRRQYVLDTLEGESIDYFQDGKVYIQANYHKGQLNGLYKKYYPNGNIADSCFYKAGILVGDYYQFYPMNKNVVLYKSYFVNAQGESMKYYTRKFDLNGLVVEDQRYIDVSIPSNVNIGKQADISFTIIGRGEYDSAILIVGDFDDRFNLQSKPDSVFFSGREAEYEFIPKRLGSQMLKGLLLVYKSEVYPDSTIEYTSYYYLEEKIFVK